MRSLSTSLLALLLSVTPLDAADAPTFETHVRPIFKAYCFECHGESAAPKAGLDLRLVRTMTMGGKSGPAVMAGKTEASLLLKRLRAGEMPPGKKKLTAADIDTISRWVAAGARIDRPEPASLPAGFQLTAADRDWWAFQPLRRPVMPNVSGAPVAIRTPVDAFVLKKLQGTGLTFSPEVDRPTLIRRATLDLHGLPPTPEEIDSFVNDPAPQAYERLIDRLLSSPRYGEHWGRHWLDVAGYADSEGYSQDDAPRSNAWKYRDYVIRSFNTDKPFDQFICEQVAGDEISGYPKANLSPADIDLLTATGFLRMAPDGTGSPGVNQIEARQAVIGDTIKIIASSLLGLTVGCAQCHNHRYDPIPQTDYYRLRALLEPAFNPAAWKPPATRQASLYTDADRKKAAAIESEAAKIDTARLKKQGEFIEATFQKELAKLPNELRDKAKAARNAKAAERTPEQKKILQEHPSLNVSAGSLYLYDQRAADELKKLADGAAKVRATKPIEEFVRALTESTAPSPPTRLLHRGDPDQPKEEIAPGGFIILDELLPLKIEKSSVATTGRRLALARWLTAPSHPLVSRVLVNRVWMHHFGRGLVGSPADFGRLGEQPTHPELLDWLAGEFVARAWSLKKLHRLLMTSTVYRLSSLATNPQSEAGIQQSTDPDNRMLGRWSVRRLEAEVIRDSILAVTGSLAGKMYGEPVPVRETDEGLIIVGKGKKDLARGTTMPELLPPGEEFRRSIYVTSRRSMPLTMLSSFDAPVMEPNCDARKRSTTATSSLVLMNDPFVEAQSLALAARVRREAGDDPRAQFTRAWRLAYGIAPSEADVLRALDYFAQLEKHFRDTAAAAPETTPAPSIDPKQRAMATICLALLNSSRFVYAD